jgi:Cu(I)/Ag(I) efflux system membrane fusion protein
MKLEPVYADSSPNTLHISPEAQRAVGVQKVEARSGLISHRFRVPGRVVADERRVYKIAPKVEGWVRELSPVTAGSMVKKGQLLATVYGRECRMAQQAYVYPLNAWDKVVKDSDPTRDLADSTAQVKLQMSEALANLQNMWMDPAQIQTIAQTREIGIDARLTAPGDGYVLARNVFLNQKFDAGTELYRVVDLNQVWIVADVFGDDQRYVPSRGTARVRIAASSGSTLTANISEAIPQFDPASHALKLRLEAPNPGLVYRPDMLVDVEFDAPLRADVAIPADAVIDTGGGKTVYVVNGGEWLSPRTVQIGWRYDGQVQVLAGLKPGERVASGATFLVDSESRLSRTALATDEHR